MPIQTHAADDSSTLSQLDKLPSAVFERGGRSLGRVCICVATKRVTRASECRYPGSFTPLRSGHSHMTRMMRASRTMGTHTQAPSACQARGITDDSFDH